MSSFWSWPWIESSSCCPLITSEPSPPCPPENEGRYITPSQAGARVRRIGAAQTGWPPPSSPWPPRMTSLPSRPLIASSPALPQITSSLVVPLIWSSAAVPVIVHSCRAPATPEARPDTNAGATIRPSADTATMIPRAFMLPPPELELTAVHLVPRVDLPRVGVLAAVQVVVAGDVVARLERVVAGLAAERRRD